MQLDSFVLLY